MFSGSLDRNHLRRSRGRPRRSDLFHEDRDRSAPVVPEKAVVEKANTKPPVAPTSGPEVPDKNMKNRVESWLQESEEDAKKAEMYLDKKRERKAGDKENPDTTKIGTKKEKNAMSFLWKFPYFRLKIVIRFHEFFLSVPKTNVLKAMETIEVASGERDKRKKTPPGSGEDRKRLIRELGRKVCALHLYFRLL